MSNEFHYENDEIVVTYDLDRCIHAGECTRGLPGVFDPDRKPWIDPDGGSSEAIADVIEQCPSGALQYEMKESEREEEPDAENTILVDPDGPLFVRGDIELRNAEGDTVLVDTRIALCRCGLSENKPFCDNSHTDGAFEDEGVLGEGRLPGEIEEEEDGTLVVTFAENGPYLLEGPATVIAADEDRCEGTKGALCRCGSSSKKPFCDGTHRDVGFRG